MSSETITDRTARLKAYLSEFRGIDVSDEDAVSLTAYWSQLAALRHASVHANMHDAPVVTVSGLSGNSDIE